MLLLLPVKIAFDKTHTTSCVPKTRKPTFAGKEKKEKKMDTLIYCDVRKKSKKQIKSLKKSKDIIIQKRDR